MISNTWYLFGWGAQNTGVRVSFPTPASRPAIGADFQELKAQVRKTGSGSTPDCLIQLYETDGVNPIATIVPASGVSGTSVLSGTWNASLLTVDTGAAVEASISATARGGSTIEIGGIEWNAALTTPISAGFLDAPSSAEFYGAAISAASSTTILEVSFENPTHTLEIGANLQEFRLQVRKSGAAGTDPQLTAELFEDGVSRGTLLSNYAISSNGGTVVSIPWNAGDLNSQGGAGVTLKITGTGAPLGMLEIGAVEWNAQPTTANVIIASTFPDAGELYGARAYGDPLNTTAALLPDGSQLYGSTLRGPILAATNIDGAVFADDYPPGDYPPLTEISELYGATLGIGMQAGLLPDGDEMYGSSVSVSGVPVAAALLPDADLLYGASISPTSSTFTGSPLYPSSILEAVGYTGAYTLLRDVPSDASDTTWLTVVS